jgi:hypothetical protein
LGSTKESEEGDGIECEEETMSGRALWQSWNSTGAELEDDRVESAQIKSIALRSNGWKVWLMKKMDCQQINNKYIIKVIFILMCYLF